jgi:septal ring factor EnvC (AmiA/AmiB activator)
VSLWLLVALLFASSPAFAQKTKGKSKQQLQSEITALQDEIDNANRLLKKTKKDKEATLAEATLLDRKIKQREKLIKAYNEQIAVLDAEIKQGQNSIKSLNTDLGKLQKEYAQMIVFAYRNRSHYNALAFVFASDDFNQAFRRLRYIRQLNDARKTKMDQIAATERRISGEVQAGQQAREQQAALLADEKAQQETLKAEKTELNKQVASLKKKEGSLQQDIKSKQQQAKKLQKAVDDIIAEEIRAAKERRKAEEKKGIAPTPAETALSSSFASNKGKLPWPVERGVISSTYGKHASVVSDKVTVTNNGIDIATEEGAQARAVFDGEVTGVTRLTGSNTVVIIRHGDYFTVYSNLENVIVKRGDKVKTKQNLGTVHTSKAENKTELHFELLKEQNRQNPAQWLKK